jgi:hypothetical protein
MPTEELALARTFSELDLEGITGVKKATDIEKTEDIKMALVGLPKSGKSKTTSTAPKPVFVWDFDDRSESIAGTPGLFVKTLVDKNQKEAKAFQELLNDISIFEYRKAEGQPIPKTFTLDSMTFLADFARNHYFKNNEAGRKVLRIGSQEFLLSRGFDPWAAEHLLLEDVIKRLFALGNTICVFHEGPEKDPRSTQENPMWTGRVSVWPDRLKSLLPMFNEVWRQTVDIDTGNYKVWCKAQSDSSGNFLAATTFNVESKEDPNIIEIIEKHKQNTNK